MNLNSGYSGYAMSIRAVEAYENGEKPLSKWSKGDIIDAISDIDKEKAAAFSKVRLPILKDTVLRRSSWHHTSNRCNATDFYKVDETVIEEMSLEEIMELSSVKSEPEKPASNKYKGHISYLEWSGTRKHPKATRHNLHDVLIEEKGCFYLVYDEAGALILKKKIGSNGTEVTKKRRGE